jgi:copper oxidase (laccase) domain-containing protein
VPQLQYITPDWPAPPNVRALTTTRLGGASRGPYESFNLGDHVGDDPGAVQRNRELLREALNLPSEPLWLKQVHGTNVVDAASAAPGVTADGAYTNRPGIVLAALTADCLPVFLCDRAGTKIALLHAGWRGLAGGVIEAGVARLAAAGDVQGGTSPGPRGTSVWAGGDELLAWLGPAIGPDSYEVGDEVRAAFVARDAAAARAFRANGPGRWRADMYELARQRLRASGVHEVQGGQHCTLREQERFFSYRRDGQCGRMASLLWLT